MRTTAWGLLRGLLRDKNNDAELAELAVDRAWPPWLTMRSRPVRPLKGRVRSVDARSEPTHPSFFVVCPGVVRSFFLSCSSVSLQPARFRGDVIFIRNEFIVIGNRGGSVR